MAAQAVGACDLVLNVVFTPGAFRYLHWFPRTLLDHSPAQVRLVANVIDEAEVAGMDAMAAEHPERVSVFRTGEQRMVPYGPLLNFCTSSATTVATSRSWTPISRRPGPSSRIPWTRWPARRR